MSQSDIDTEMNRDLGLLDAVSLGVGTMIAAGIFVLSGLAVANVGAMAAVAFIIAGIVALFTAFAYAEFSSIYPESGGGYAYVANTFDGDWTYIIGWAMVLGYPASAAFYLASFSDWFYRFMYPAFNIPSAVPYWIPGLVILGLLIVLNLKGTEESGKFQIVVTGLKVVLILLFLYGGLQSFDASAITGSLQEHLTSFREIAITSALVFITFFGFEAIATNAEEIEDPGRNVPRAIFISMAFVTVIYLLVVTVIVLAVNDVQFLQFLADKASLSGIEEARTFIGENGEVSMGRAAQYYLGDVGFYVIIVGALFSMLSAANATILAGSRVKLAMARRSHLPDQFEEIHPEFGTPAKSVLLTGGLILLYIVVFTVIFGSVPGGHGGHSSSLLGVESIAHFADFMLLLGLIAVNVALVYSRRTKNLDRQFKVPGVPYVPAVAVLSNLVLIINVEPVSLATGLISISVGVVLWFTVIGTTDVEEIEKETPTVVSKKTVNSGKDSVLVPIANPDHAEQLLETARSVASDVDGEVKVLSVVKVPEQTPLSNGSQKAKDREETLDEILDSVDMDVPISGLIRVAHEVDEAILNTIEQYDCKTVVIGWSGSRAFRRNLVLGSVVDNVSLEADADVLVERIDEDRDDAIDEITVPVVQSPHAELAAETATSISRSENSTVNLVSVRNDSMSRVDRDALDTIGDKIASDDVEVEKTVVESEDVVQSILDESEDSQLTVIGAAREGILQQFVFGNKAVEIAEESNNTVIMAKRNSGLKSNFKEFIYKLRT